MGLFKKKAEKKNINTSITFTETVNGKTKKVSVDKDVDMDRFQKDMKHLTPKGELPWGWVTYNKKFTDEVEAEVQIFRNRLNEARTDAEKFSALGTFVNYFEAAKKKYKKVGECEGRYFEWMYEGEMAKRKKQFEEMKSKLKGV